jgi:NAD(P)-dependent dehydrogenase (short-subunit alcohol dehydrogenase family)
MQRRQHGRFIAISTECAMQTHPTQSAYTSGKRGMDAIIRVLAKEVGSDGITVNQASGALQCVRLQSVHQTRLCWLTGGARVDGQ